MSAKLSSVAAVVVSLMLASYGFAVLAQQANEQESKSIIEDALKAGPQSITERAAVKDLNWKVIRAGSNGWTCYPGPNLHDGKDSMCHDTLWDNWMVAWKTKSDFQPDRVGISYMLAGDEGASNIDPFATGPSDDNDWIVEGPHMMIILPDSAMLEGFSTDPHNGGPYVMWKGTPYAHIMVPIGPR